MIDDHQSEIDPFICPICYLAMTPLSRSPMILNCNHVICKTCLFKYDHKNCLICGVGFSTFKVDENLSQAIEKYQQDHSIP
jgi:hypothetical protein